MTVIGECNTLLFLYKERRDFLINKYTNLKIKDYEDVYSLVEGFVRGAHSIIKDQEKDSIAIYAKADFIYSIFKILIEEYDFEVGFIDLARFYYNNEYDCEYCIRITDEGHITIEKARNDEFAPYKLYNEVSMFYQEECEQDLIDISVEDNSNITILFGICEDEEYKECEYQCRCGCNKDTTINYSTDKDGETHGFTASKSDGNSYYSYSYYTDSILDKDIVRDLLGEFGF